MDASGWDERYDAAELVWGRGPNAQVAQRLADLEPGTALDVAGGEGRNAIWLAERGWDATNVDFSAAGLQRSRRLAAEAGVEVRHVEADVTTWTPDTTYDLVLLAYVQLAGPPRRALLDRVPAWVATGGTLMIVAHDASNVTDGHGGPPSEDVCYDLDETVALLDPLEIDVAEVHRRQVATDAGTAVALDTLVLARRTA